ncbi:TPA: Holliday junction resolvase RuvX [Candidatus Scatousia excrementigallinarum]|uniref:Putative pre-16S rRNA nuclease n=1 Tax=Candidatus Scatousia excrementigallinarum TaxID=2840935 RepID=A0A9D1EY90_9BACT|nr:Holliday junction resolvase RuvX [Candidatus Scatousia excrementigallinarum]
MYKVMALDIGTKRIGIALSDYLLMLANGHSFISRQPEDKAVELIEKTAKDNNVKIIVVGVPLNMDGTKGSQADDCINFSKKLTGYEIIYEDERLTSDTAEENLRNKKIDFRKNKGLVDIESACIILEQYLSRKK